jgi:hypothetical protein
MKEVGTGSGSKSEGAELTTRESGKKLLNPATSREDRCIFSRKGAVASWMGSTP